MPQEPIESLIIRRRSSFKTTPWKNRGGLTHEAIRVPESGDAFRWRISVAEIGASGPFSDFRGYQRKMVLLRGGGLTLGFEDGAKQRLEHVGDIVEFDGAQRAQCELLAGPCVDLNLMVTDAIPDVRARVQGVAGPSVVDSLVGEALVIFAIAGSVLIAPAAGALVTLDAWDLAVVRYAQAAVTTLDRRAAAPRHKCFSPT